MTEYKPKPKPKKEVAMETIKDIIEKVKRRLTEAFPGYKFSVHIEGNIHEVKVNIEEVNPLKEEL